MNNKISITVGSAQKTFFLQKGFYSRDTTVSPIHKHYYTELHISVGGKIDYTIGRKTYSITDGELFAVPPNVPHACTYISPGTAHCSMLLDTPVTKLVHTKLSSHTVKDFFTEIKKASENDNYSKISAYLALIYSTVFENEQLSVDKIEDYSFIIEEYLKINYSKDIKLSDLAAELNLSEKHTERLVKKYTGNTFKQELSSIRIKTAQMLIASTDMTMTEISEYVGYNSYSGFYKAYKKNI